MLISPIKEINDLRMSRASSRPTACEKMLVINGMVIVRLPRGRFWCGWKNLSVFAYTPGHWSGKCNALLTGLHRLGLISGEAMKRHMAACDAATAAQQLRTDQRELDGLARKHGFKAPKLKAKVA